MNKLNPRTNNMKIASLFVISFVFCNYTFSQTRLRIQEKKRISIETDSLGELFKIAGNLFFKEIICPLEDYDSILESNKDSLSLACFFSHENKKIYVSDLLKDIHYKSNWLISESNFIDHTNTKLIVSLSFFSGNSSRPLEYFFLIDLVSYEFKRIDIIRLKSKSIKFCER